jgi:hypothetical protein
VRWMLKATTAAVIATTAGLKRDAADDAQRASKWRHRQTARSAEIELLDGDATAEAERWIQEIESPLPGSHRAMLGRWLRRCNAMRKSGLGRGEIKLVCEHALSHLWTASRLVAPPLLRLSSPCGGRREI